MSYEIITDRLEVRSSIDRNKPRYIVEGYALVPNKYDSYGYQKDSKGDVTKVFKSMFTDHCIKSIQEQSKHKSFFVDTKHELFHNLNIKSIIKGKVTPEEEKLIDSFLNSKMLPIAKCNDIIIDDKGLYIKTELNPMFKEVDDYHGKYFDAVWHNLENKYLNGISINFIPTDVVKDENGNDIINDVDISGFSYVDRPSLPDHNIVEVAIRSARDFLNVRESGEKMEEEKKQFEAEKAKLEEEKRKVESEKADIEKARKESEKKELERQKEDYDRQKKELEAKSDALKKAEEEKQKLQEELNSAKGVVRQQTPPAQTMSGQQYGDKFYEDNIRKITSEHDKTMETYRKGQQPIIDNSMKNFSELANLQAKVGFTAGLPPEYAAEIKRQRLLDRGKADIITNRK